jgi:hypothetical protein
MSYWDSIHKNLEKNLGDTHEELPVEYNDSGKQRKLDALMGASVQRPRQEWVEKEQKEEDKAPTETEIWERNRINAQEYAERDRAVAMKRDELAETDGEGYRFEPESPAFREGFNNTLRVKPPQNLDLHNGSEMNIQGKALESFFAKQIVKGNKKEKTQGVELQIENNRVDHDTEVRVNDPLKATLRANKHDLKIKELFKPQSRVEIFTPNKKGVRKTLLKRDLYSGLLASYILKVLFTENNSFDLKLTQEQKHELKAIFKNGEVEIKELGKVFVELGFVLPPQMRDETKRVEFDAKAMELGRKIMMTMEINSLAKPMVEESKKEDLALAIGRTMKNLECMVFESSLKNEFTHEKTKKNKEIQNVGKKTLQIIDHLSRRVEKKGSTSYFRTEKNIEKEQENKPSAILAGVPKNMRKSVWDGMEKDLPNKTTRDILPARPDYL